jgi:hypothetical protein
METSGSLSPTSVDPIGQRGSRDFSPYDSSPPSLAGSAIRSIANDAASSNREASDDQG